MTAKGLRVLPRSGLRLQARLAARTAAWVSLDCRSLRPAMRHEFRREPFGQNGALLLRMRQHLRAEAEGAGLGGGGDRRVEIDETEHVGRVELQKETRPRSRDNGIGRGVDRQMHRHGDRRRDRNASGFRPDTGREAQKRMGERSVSYGQTLCGKK